MKKKHGMIIITAILLAVAIVSCSKSSTSYLNVKLHSSDQQDGTQEKYFYICGLTDEEVTKIEIPAELYNSETNEMLPVSYVEEKAFMGNKNITQVYIYRNQDSKVFDIRSEAFRDCANLSYLKIGRSVVGDYAFSGCVSLAELQGSMKEVGSYAFDGCTSLKKLSLADTDKVGSYAFKDCTSLTTVSLPKDIELASNAFDGCTKICTVNYDGTLSEWKSRGYDLGLSHEYNIVFLDGIYNSANLDSAGQESDDGWVFIKP